MAQLEYDRLIQNSGDIAYFGHVRFPHSFWKTTQATTINYTYVLDR